MGAFGWHTPKTTLIKEEKSKYQLVIPQPATNLGFQKGFSFSLTPEVAASQGPATEAARIHIHLSTLNISPGRLLLSARLLWLGLPVQPLWACQQNAPSFSRLPWECERERALRTKDRKVVFLCSALGTPHFPGLRGC